MGCVPIRGISEDIAGVVGNDVENDVDSLLVCGLNKVAKLFSCPEVRIHVEKVLNSVTVIARLERHLSENRADPKGSDAEAPQVAEFAFQAPERAALPAATGTEPNIVVDSTGVFRAVERRGSVACRASIVVPEATVLVPIGEPVQKQKIDNLILPRGRRRHERPLGQRCEVKVQKAFFDFLGHCRISSQFWRPATCCP